jgi:hypothetical protein
VSKEEMVELAERLAVVKQDAQVARNSLNSAIERMIDIEVALRTHAASMREGK